MVSTGFPEYHPAAAPRNDQGPLRSRPKRIARNLAFDYFRLALWLKSSTATPIRIMVTEKA